MRAAFATFIVIVAGLLAVAAASGQSLDSPLAPSADIASSWRFHGDALQEMATRCEREAAGR